MEHILSGMQYLCDETRMLTGLSVAYGTAYQHEALLHGRSQEIALDADGRFVPSVRPLAEESIFDLASLSKLFTAVLSMQLVEDGLLSLDETVGSIDPRFHFLHEVSVFDVLSFRAGLQTDGRIDTAPTREEGLRRLFASRWTQLPRIRIYSDINAMIMKYIIEQKTGIPFAEALHKRILDPAGMAHTYAQVPDALKPRCVCYNYEHRIAGGSYTLRKDILPGTVNDPKAALLSQNGADLCGHAGLFSTCGDMIRFAQALLRGKLIHPDTLRAIGTDRTGFHYGDGTYRQHLGFLCFAKHPDQHLSEVPAWMSSHALALSGFTGNHLSIDPETGCFVLFLGNRCHGRVSSIVPEEGGHFTDYGVAENGVGYVLWPDGRAVPSSARYVYFKDERLHTPVHMRMQRLGWL